MSPKFSLLFLVVALYFKTGDSIQCYICSSHGSDMSCVKGYSRLGIDQPCQVTTDRPGLYCAKAVGYVNGVYYTSRGCTVDGKNKRAPFDFNGVRFESGELVTCKSDLCNFSPISSPNFMFIVCVLLFNMIINRTL